jgi:hypothetical protein
MAGDITTSSGAKLYIGAAVTTAASDTLAEFIAMTSWVEVGLVESLSAFGDKANVVTFAAINDARMRKQKGVKDAGDLSVSVAWDPTDTGQIALDAAAAATSAYAFMVRMPNGSTFKYFRAYVVSNPVNVGGNDNVIKTEYQLAIDSEIFTGAS